ncbi:hypothetical protein G6F57_010478 [Rhizopus arrhizus]|uniref:RecA family profile 1 domain-containing protein n=1 Tax=Rhizopus oryzae TaxID=64495 RepID=A0A9P6X1T4_RHIOR|nr:hypothetical protein G6F23_006594 [Rhizopus arrhizus]KAG1412736.1 hypothetical protein G6F58_007871 [Rhizopus delemar]KAG0759486.1 hypothetical protein G6F24_009030 [Rhizopus arrhizus]KAG0787619.1 hypothetical protein G6F21_007783 [Rhizopus arrhizus]KAG0796586.1 hypothetical protein G6F22_004877 [Rhizopus arrhizus]
MKQELEQLTKSLGVFEKLEHEGLDSPQEILPRSASDLQRLLQLDPSSVESVLDAASIEAYDWRLREQVGNELVGIESQAMLTTGDEIFDDILKGGIPLGTITEVVGESSSGKTQLGLQLCLSVQKPVLEGGLEGSAVYIHSEGPFPSARLNQLVDKYTSDNNNLEAEQLKNHIHTMRVTDGESQYRVLAYQLPAFLELQQQRSTRKVQLIVIDSISAIYRSDGAYKQRFEKMAEICEIGMRLKKLASKYNVAVVTINQVTDVPDTSLKGNAFTEHMEEWLDFNLVNQHESNRLGLYIHSLLKRPVLGLSWQNSVNTRIRLARSQMMDNTATRRILFIEFSPQAERRGCEIMIDDTGIHAI